MPDRNPLFYNVYRLSLLSFVLAAATGALFRYGLIYSLPEGLSLDNIRHAHTHLMFFNWISPPVMAWMAAVLIKSGATLSVSSTTRCLYTMLVLGFLSYPFFLLYGYSPVNLGFASLPASAIISGLIMFTWYWFAALYFSHRRQTKPTPALEIFDGALIALLVSSLGAWGVSAAQLFEGIPSLIPSALTYFFLNVFTEGWAVLAAIGIIWSSAGIKNPNINWSLLYLPVLFGSMLLFPISFAKSLMTDGMLLAAKTGLILIVISLSINLFFFLTASHERNRFLFYSILVLLALKIAAQTITLFPNDFWIGSHGLRILYLHLVMLGIISAALINFLPFSKVRSPFISSFFMITVWLLLLSLTPISGYWPSSLTIPDVYFWIFLIALLPLFPALLMLLKPSNHTDKV
jgi:hypothetical protein